MKNNVRILLLIFWIIVIFILTGYPSLKAPQIKRITLDKLYHFIIFFILGILEYRILKTYLFFLIGCSIAICAELQQLIIPSRDFEIFDIFAGILGLCVAYFLYNGRRIIRNAISKT